MRVGSLLLKEEGVLLPGGWVVNVTMGLEHLSGQ